MDISTTTRGTEVYMSISGAIDEKGAEQLKKAFESLQLGNVKSVCLDFAQVNFIGSAGLGKLLLFYKKTSTADVAVRIDHCTSEIRELMQEVRLNALFSIS